MVRPGLRDPYAVEVGARLRLTARALGFATQKAFAEELGWPVTTKAVDAWFNGRALPPVPRMLHLVARFDLTLDWIFRGDESRLSAGFSIRLAAARAGMDVPPAHNAPGVGDEPPEQTASRPAAAVHVLRQGPVRSRPMASADGRNS